MNTREIAKEFRMSHWAGIMQDRIESGQSIKVYCKNAGLRESMYYYWQKKLREAACGELMKVQHVNMQGNAPAGFVEAKLTVQSTMPPSANPNDQLCVEVGGIRFAAGCGYPVDKLIAVLREVTVSC